MTRAGVWVTALGVGLLGAGAASAQAPPAPPPPPEKTMEEIEEMHLRDSFWTT